MAIIAENGVLGYARAREPRMEIAIALDTYDDLFSDFDIRGYGERAISKDFLDELRIRLRRLGAKTGFDIVFLVPRKLRNAEAEALIADRLRAFFDERRKHYLGEARKAKRNSLLFVLAGLLFSFAANFLVERYNVFPMFRDFLLIPAWFFVWSGLELFLSGREEIGRKRDYYASLSGSRILFWDIDGYREKGRPRREYGSRA